MAAGEASPTLDTGHTGLVEETEMEMIQPVHLSAHTVEQPGHIGVHRADAESIGRCIRQLMPCLCSVHQQLLRDTSADHAGAPHPIPLDDRDPGPMTGRTFGRGQSAGTGSENDQIKGGVHVAHREVDDSAEATLPRRPTLCDRRIYEGVESPCSPCPTPQRSPLP